jgi:hypothetical protein
MAEKNRLNLPDLSRCSQRKLRTQLALRSVVKAKKTAKEKYEARKKALAEWKGWF